MNGSSRQFDLVCEIQRLLGEEDLSRQESNRRHDIIKKKFVTLKVAIGDHTDDGTIICQEKRPQAGKHAGGCKGTPINNQAEWITIAEAAWIAEVHRGTIKRMADSGRIKDNGQKGHRRRVEKPSVLQWIGKRLEKQRQRAFTNYERNLDDLPDEH